MTPKIKSAIRSAMRKAWMWYCPNRKLILSKNKKLPNTSLPFIHYKCSICKEDFATREIRVDHVDAAGKFDSWKEFGEWCERLFTGKLQLVCIFCHKKKTVIDRAKMKKKK